MNLRCTYCRKLEQLIKAVKTTNISRCFNLFFLKHYRQRFTDISKSSVEQSSLSKICSVFFNFLCSSTNNSLIMMISMKLLLLLTISYWLSICSASFTLFSGIDNLLKPRSHYLRKESISFKLKESATSGYVQVQRFSNGMCSAGTVIGEQFFKINTCNPLPHGQYFAKFVLSNDGSVSSKQKNYLQIEVFSDSSCLRPIGIPTMSNFPLNQCEESTFLSIVNEVIPSSDKDIIVITYRDQGSCKSNSLTSENLIQGNTFQPGVCNEGQLGDFMIDSCNLDGKVVKGLSFLSTDGSCSGISSKFSFSTSQSCGSDEVKMTDVGFFRFSGFSNFICSAVISDSSVYPSNLVM
jgi:hypothetical protein